MGLDLLDLNILVKRRLGVEVDLSALPDGHEWDEFQGSPLDLSVGEYFDAVVASAAATGIELPPHCWTTICLSIAEVGGLKTFDLDREMLLRKDLGLE